jgi:hypothetical protein
MLTALYSKVKEQADRLIPAVIVVVCGFIYLRTLYPGIGGRINYGDSVKFQFLAFTDGLPHSTGFPLYLILSKVASNTLTLIPQPERVAILSTFFGILSVIFVHLIMEKVKTFHFSRHFAGMGFPETEPPIYRIENLSSLAP